MQTSFSLPEREIVKDGFWEKLPPLGTFVVCPVFYAYRKVQFHYDYMDRLEIVARMGGGEELYNKPWIILYNKL